LQKVRQLATNSSLPEIFSPHAALTEARRRTTPQNLANHGISVGTPSPQQISIAYGMDTITTV
jgi:hypothetical protein